MAPAVLLRAAVCVTGRFPALAGVDLAVAQGEVVVLEGPNGAGKTSVLRVCAGLQVPREKEATTRSTFAGQSAIAASRDVSRPSRQAGRLPGAPRKYLQATFVPK